MAAVIELSDLNGSNGFVINGINSGDESGRSVSLAGDLNGDGVSDFIIGARNADPNGKSNAGESYVVFGSTGGFAASLELSGLNGSNGFVINGVDVNDSSGFSVSAAGDVNGDGIDDLIIGAAGGDPNTINNAGESYVVFGSTGGFAASLDLSSLNGSNGFVLNGIDAYDQSGWSVSSAGDINGDGVDDLIIGAWRADPNGSISGESYVVFGSLGGFGASLELSDLNGSNGFVIGGIDAGDRSGYSVSSAGDINGDGIDDLIIGASHADSNGQSSAGESYVVFGSTVGFSASFNLSDLNGSNGFIINGFDASDNSGLSVSAAGDVNGDGIDDLLIGAFGADPNGVGAAGESYIIFGNAPPVAQDDAISTDEESVVSGSVKSNNGSGIDSDINDTLLTVTEVNGSAINVGMQITLASGALLTLNANGAFIYDPNGQFESLALGASDTDSFTYRLADDGGGEDTATVTITINGANDGLTAQDDDVTTNEDTTLGGSVFSDNGNGADSDTDAGDTLTITRSTDRRQMWARKSRLLLAPC